MSAKTCQQRIELQGYTSRLSVFPGNVNFEAKIAELKKSLEPHRTKTDKLRVKLGKLHEELVNLQVSLVTLDDLNNW